MVVIRAATYGRFQVKDFHRGQYVSFVPHERERPLLKEVAIERSDHLAFRGLRIARARAFYSSELAFVANEVTFENDFSPGRFRFYFSDHLSVEQNKFHDINGGIYLRGTSDVSLRGNEFVRIPLPSRRVAGDGIQASDVKRVIISGNLFEQFRDIPHSDAIEFSRNNADVTIEANRFHKCRGLIVVTGDEVTPPVRNTGWLIANNEFTEVRQWALRFLNSDAARIINNTVWDAGSRGINLYGDTTRAVILNNIISRLVAVPGMIETEDYNLIGAGYRRGPHDLAGHPRFVDPASLNFHLAAGSPGIDAGTSDGAPLTDLEGKPRLDAPDVPNRGGGSPRYFDMGAYEFQN
jgi:hypothetical protein